MYKQINTNSIFYLQTIKFYLSNFRSIVASSKKGKSHRRSIRARKGDSELDDVDDSEFLADIYTVCVACCFMGCVMTPRGVWQSPEET